MVVSTIAKALAKKGLNKLSKKAKDYLKDATKSNLKMSKEVTTMGKRGDFGPKMSGRAAAKELKTSAKESSLKSGMVDLNLYKKHGEKPLHEARKYLKRKKIEYRNQKESLRKRGMSEGGLIKGKPKLALRGWK